MKNLFTILVLLLGYAAPTFSYTTEELKSSLQLGKTQLFGQINSDGSWGANEIIKPLYTAESLLALRSVSPFTQQYTAGVAWLLKSNPGNIDTLSRRIEVLKPLGYDSSGDLAYLQSIQYFTGSTYPQAGAGLNREYHRTPLDTAYLVNAMSDLNQTSMYLDYARFFNNKVVSGTNGWAIAGQSTVDKLVTAEVLIAYEKIENVYPTGYDYLIKDVINAAEPIIQGVDDTASNLLMAKAVYALYKRNGTITPQITSLLNKLIANQNVAGHWDNDIYVTTQVMKTFALILGIDGANNLLRVSVPDPDLRKKINQLLGKNNFDQIYRGELLALTSLDLTAYPEINDLTGLEYAYNLTDLYLARILAPTDPVDVNDVAVHYTTEDFDNDDVNDGWEFAYYGNLTGTDGSLNPDGDSLTDHDEALQNGNPFLPFHIMTDRVVSQKNKTIVIPLADLLENDYNYAAQTLSVTASSTNAKSRGTVSFSSNGIQYAPNTNWYGNNEILYTISNGTSSTSGKILIKVTDTGSTIAGTSENEILFAAGNGSVVDPGEGNDIIYDAPGDDTFYFDYDYGIDRLTISDSSSGRDDIVNMASGITQSDLIIQDVNDDMKIALSGSSDALVIKSHYLDPKTRSMTGMTFNGTGLVTTFAVDDKILTPEPCLEGYTAPCDVANMDTFILGPSYLTMNDFDAQSNELFVSDQNLTPIADISDGPYYVNFWGFTSLQMTLSGKNPVFDYDTTDLTNTDKGRVNVTLTSTDPMVGTANNEILSVGDGMTVNSAGGNDYIDAAGGTQNIQFGLGHGKDKVWILDGGSSADTLTLLSSLTYQNYPPSLNHAVRFERKGHNLLIRPHGYSDQVSVEHFYSHDPYSLDGGITSFADFNQIVFSDASHAAMSRTDIVARATDNATNACTGGGSGTSCIGTSAGNTIAGSSSDDVIFGRDQADALSGNNGNDYLYGEEGNDNLYGGNGADYLYGDSGNDYLFSESGDDYMEGGAGIDSYVISYTYGNDIIENLDLGTTPASSLTYDAIRFSGAITSMSQIKLAFGTSTNDLIVTTTEGANTSTATFLDFFSGDYWAANAYFVNTIGGAQGLLWKGDCLDYDQDNDADYDENDDGVFDDARVDYNASRPSGEQYGCIKNRVVYDNITEGDDVIVVGFADNYISGKGGHDQISTGGGIDFIHGNSGNDTISAGGGEDTIWGDDGDDIIMGDMDNDLMYGGNGSDTIFPGWGDANASSSQESYGGPGNDHLYGGHWGGKDKLMGEDGNDSYYVVSDDDSEYIEDNDTSYDSGEIDQLKYLGNIIANELWFYVDDVDLDGNNDDLVIMRITTDKYVYLLNWASNEDKIEQITTESGNCSILSHSNITGLLTIMPPKTGPEPVTNFTDSQLSPYWDGSGC